MGMKQQKKLAMHRLIEIVFSSARSSYNHPGLLVFQQHPVLIYNIIKTIASAARLQELTQHISWPHGNINGDQLAPPGNCMVLAWFDETLWQLWDSFETTLRQLRNNLEKTLRQLWNKFGMLWDNFETTVRNIVTQKKLFWESFETILGLLSDNLDITSRKVLVSFWTIFRVNICLMSRLP